MQVREESFPKVTKKIIDAVGREIKATGESVQKAFVDIIINQTSQQ